ncbi:hypothetical protein H8R18_08255 [Nanchangia anserum]|uniref:Bacterial SCP orthologue domain-containing protein n=1 Tax=Nanchangia anserum TaxID=2692125 RepID=A0A8I0KNP8_9ACTO|nr:sterol carrier family protein [Nanchangia anserum]MBD3689511.1 hypothetical protein [Nanchangia anserum]QOX81700.1 hypothetical protein H8R18_08255 [Nanchangia anserum]
MPAPISAEAGIEALTAWLATPDTLARPLRARAVRYLLQRLAADHPGRAVEVRVPPFGAVQILEGTTHRRGTPPAVIEMDADTWLSLATGSLTWGDALAAHRVSASGQRTDLAPLLPVISAGDL